MPGGRAGVPCRQARCAEHDGRTRQRRVIRREPHALGVDGEQFGEDRAEFRQSADAAVVAAVRAGCVALVAEAGQRQQLVGEV